MRHNIVDATGEFGVLFCYIDSCFHGLERPKGKRLNGG
jgi:hypothetical protein